MNATKVKSTNMKQAPRSLLREKIDDPLWLAERLYFKLLRKAADDAEASSK